MTESRDLARQQDAVAAEAGSPPLPDAGTPRPLRPAGRAQGFEVESRRERRSPEPGHLTGGALGDEGGHGASRRPRRTKAKRPRRTVAQGAAAGSRTALGNPIPADACRSMPARRAKEVSIGTNWTCSEGGWSRPRGQQRPCSSTLASSSWYGVLGAMPHSRPRLRQASVMRRGSPPSHPRNMRRGREDRRWVAMARGHGSRPPREDGPKARLTGASTGTTRHPGAPPVASSGAHPLAEPSSGGASALVLAAQLACGVAE
jgi:hypothetical protein